MEYVLRKAGPADTARIEELFVEMLKTIYHTDDAEGYQAGHLDRFYSGKEDWICVAEYENDVVAFLSIEVYRGNDYIYLDDLSVTEKCRRKGMGTQLIQTAEQYAKELGITRVVLHVERANEAAYRLYSRLGYNEDADEGSRVRMSKSI